MTFEKIVALIGLIATIPVYKGWFLRLVSWNKSRKISYLERQLEFITKLHDDNRLLMIYIGQSILTVVGFIAASQIYQLMDVAKVDKDITPTFISLVSLVAYLSAVYFVGKLTKVRDYEKYSKNMKDNIKRIKEQLTQ